MTIVLVASLALLAALFGVAAIGRTRAALPPGEASPRQLPPAEGPTPTPATQAPALAQSATAATPPIALNAAPERPAASAEAQRYRAGLAKTRGGFISRLDALFRGKPQVNSDLRDELETVLFTSDIGAKTAQMLIDRIESALARNELADRQAVWAELRSAIEGLVQIPAPEINYKPEQGPYVLLMVGVNGVGKTTTLAKLAAMHRAAGRSVLLVAGDTFRAAATEQLETWGARIDVPVHAGKPGADPAGVIHDGIARGRRENFDVVLCDTAGRLHTRSELMDELGKMYRSATKALSSQREVTVQPHDVFLTLDATIGQNALAQAQLFKDTCPLTGLVITKLDGTAKGGVVLGICDTMRVPIRFIGIGEKIDDLRPFSGPHFVDALLSDGD